MMMFTQIQITMFSGKKNYHDTKRQAKKAQVKKNKITKNKTNMRYNHLNIEH